MSADDAWTWTTVVDLRYAARFVRDSTRSQRARWELTQAEDAQESGYKAASALRRRAYEHAHAVLVALRMGLPVPANVRADYPGLVMIYGEGDRPAFVRQPCPENPSITIGHSAESGTYIFAPRRWNEAIKGLGRGFKWWDEGGYWYRTASKGSRLPTVNLDYLADQLRAAGASVCVEGVAEVTEEEARAIKREHLEGRSLRYWERSQKARATAAAQWDASARAVAGIEPGQPILVGHHSEKAMRRAQERSLDAALRSVDASREAGRLAGQARHLEQAAARLAPEAVEARNDDTARVEALSALVSKHLKRDVGAATVRKTHSSAGS
jgi:hypothetical protein